MLLFAKISLVLTLLFTLPALAPANPLPAPSRGEYQLSISFDLPAARLIGTARVTIPAGEQLALFFPQLELTGSLLRDQDGREQSLQPLRDALILPAVDNERTLYLSYTRQVAPGGDNQIGEAGIVLTGNWYPIPQQPLPFTLSATLPEHFTALTESDRFPLERQGNTVHAHFSVPSTTIHFIAGPYLLGSQPVRDGLTVYSLFFAEDQELADGYRQAAAIYLQRFEAEIGPFPYNHYVITANRLPTGYGMPTFTLLGQAVLRLPFIKETSLGHEIVHSWFGNAVGVDSHQGNWCEGLTTFLTDHAFREDRGEGAAVRLEAISRYLSQVHPEAVMPLAAFTSASHRQEMAEAKRAVGYQRGAMLFHELREHIGPAALREGLRRFYADNIGRRASWSDLQASFSATSGQNLSRFFTERLQRTDLPQLDAQEIRIEYQGAEPVLIFSLRQLSDEPFSLAVPVWVETATGVTRVRVSSSAAATEVRIPLKGLPVELRLDPEFSMLRQLDAAEFPPVWSRLLGAPDPLVILGDEEQREIYQPLLGLLAPEQPRLLTGLTATNQELAKHDLLFLGSSQPAARALFATPGHPEDGLTIDVRRNPFNDQRIAVLVSSPDRQQTAAAARLLRHYGRYSYLEFADGRIREKRVTPGQSGLTFVIDQLPAGGASSALNDFSEIVGQLAEARVIYVGETHTSLADHHLQLRLIEALHAKDPRVAIAMEMFPASAQPVLDRYTLGDGSLSEADFLKESGYYQVWRFDYRLYRDIVNFARRHGLPVRGINLDRQIVSAVFQGGGTEGLTAEQRQALPLDRDLDLPGYLDRLSAVHNQHLQGGHGSGSLAGFVQAQALWDETMAAEVVAFLRDHPEHRLVVLAGSQHTRKDSGIPPRVARQLPVSQRTVLNIGDDVTPSGLADQTDFFFFNPPVHLAETPKIGVVLETITSDSGSALQISELSPHGKAAVAGLLPGDIIVTIDGVAVAEMADLQIALLDRRAGDTIQLAVLRPVGDEQHEKNLTVELSHPPPGRPHP